MVFILFYIYKIYTISEINSSVGVIPNSIKAILNSHASIVPFLSLSNFSNINLALAILLSPLFLLIYIINF
jgi:hypothetical protein